LNKTLPEKNPKGEKNGQVVHKKEIIDQQIHAKGLISLVVTEFQFRELFPTTKLAKIKKNTSTISE